MKQIKLTILNIPQEVVPLCFEHQHHKTRSRTKPDYVRSSQKRHPCPCRKKPAIPSQPFMLPRLWGRCAAGNRATSRQKNSKRKSLVAVFSPKERGKITFFFSFFQNRLAPFSGDSTAGAFSRPSYKLWLALF